MKSIYLKNYKAIHHIFNLVIFILFLKLLGLNDIFTSIPAMIMILVINYFIVVFSLEKSGLNEEVAKQLKNKK
jgi:Na+/H+ antiporter NhaD/arsenite permease-like protein